MKQKNLENEKQSQVHAARPALSQAPSSLFEFKTAQFFFDDYRFTYTCLFNEEVVAIHFDSKRNEIFYKGHNIRNMALSEEQKLLLQHCGKLLLENGQTLFAEKFKICLRKI